MSSPMLRRRPTRARTLRCALRRLARGQDGSFLVEAMMSAVIIVVVGVGVLEVIDRSSRLGGQQEAQAIAGNLAQTEQEQVRAMSLSDQARLRRTTPKDVDGYRYSVSSRADWITDTTGDADCTTAASSADYLKLSTVVTWTGMGTRKPVTLESLITPGVRSFGPGQGSLAVQVTDRDGAGVSGLQLGLAGPATQSDTTSASGCVLWGYLPAGGGYTLGFSRPPDYVTPDGQQVVSKPVTVVGEQTSNVALQYDRGGYLTTSFVTRKTRLGANIATSPQFAHVTHPSAGGVSVSWPVTDSATTSPLLFPFASAYTVQPDSCSASDTPPVPEEPTPSTPVAPAPVTGIVTSGMTTPASAVVRIPSPNIRVVSGSTLLSGATVRVTTGCGTVYRRLTQADGTLADPGFPYTRTLAICVAQGGRQLEAVRSNTNFNMSLFTSMDLSTSTTSGTCA
jgi:Tfp pilus assembly protein PilV